MCAAEPDGNLKSTRVPAKLPTAFGRKPYLLGFFKVDYDVAVMVCQNPVLDADTRVYMALVLAVVQDARAVATYSHGHEPTVLAEVSAAHIAQATRLHEKTVPRSLRRLHAAGAIHWRRGNAHHQPAFALCLNPPSVTASGYSSSATPSVTASGSPLVTGPEFKAVSPWRGKELQEPTEEGEQEAMPAVPATSEKDFEEKGGPVAARERVIVHLRGSYHVESLGVSAHDQRLAHEWDALIAKLPPRPMHIYREACVELSDTPLTLTLWFRYGFHHIKAQEHADELTPKVKAWLTREVVIEYRLLPPDVQRPAALGGDVLAELGG